MFSTLRKTWLPPHVPGCTASPWAMSPLPHSLPEVDCEGTRSRGGNGSIPSLSALSPRHKAGSSPRSLQRTETVFSLQPRPSGEHPQQRDGPRGARHTHPEQQQAPSMSFGGPPSHGSLPGLPPRGQVPRSQVRSKSNRTFSRSSPSSRLRSPPSPGRIPPAPRHYGRSRGDPGPRRCPAEGLGAARSEGEDERPAGARSPGQPHPSNIPRRSAEAAKAGSRCPLGPQRGKLVPRPEPGETIPRRMRGDARRGRRAPPPGAAGRALPAWPLRRLQSAP